MLLGAVVIGAGAVFIFTSDSTDGKPGEPENKGGAIVSKGKPAAKSEVKTEPKKSTKISETPAAAKPAPVRRKKPDFEIDKSDEENLTEAQRRLLEEVRAALRGDDYKSLMKLVKLMQESNEWPDGIPDSIKKAALEALGWYGSKTAPEIVGFLGDANPAIVSAALDYWEDAISEIDSDRELAVQIKLAAQAVHANDTMESILGEIVSGMRHSVAVETIIAVMDNGNAIAAANISAVIEDLTGSTTIKTAEDLAKWLDENPDDPTDEDMYGGMTGLDDED